MMSAKCGEISFEINLVHRKMSIQFTTPEKTEQHNQRLACIPREQGYDCYADDQSSDAHHRQHGQHH